MGELLEAVRACGVVMYVVIIAVVLCVLIGFLGAF